MRAYLSSFRLGDHPDRVLGLLGDQSGPACVIANAMDPAPHRRREGVEREVGALGTLGIDAVELDLRNYFGRPDETAAELARYRLVWVRGGNVFALRYVMARSGADAALVDLLARDAVVYGGYSAGPCVLGPSLEDLAVVDDPGSVTTTYGAEPITSGLHVLPYRFVPHVYSPGHPETDALTRLAGHYRSTGVDHVALADGQALVIDGDNIEVI